MKKLGLSLFSLLLFFSFPTISICSEKISGKAEIIDGDTIKVDLKHNNLIFE